MRGRAPLTDVATSKLLAYWSDNVVPNDFSNNAQVLICKWMFVHERVHCRKDVSWSLRRKCTKEGGL